MSYDYWEYYTICPRCREKYSDADGTCSKCFRCSVCSELESWEIVKDFNGRDMCLDCYETTKGDANEGTH